VTNISNEKKGLHRILEFTFIYNLVQNVLGSTNAHDVFINEYIKPVENNKILDFGSGTGTLFEDLKNINGITYIGIEPNSEYVKKCSQLYEDFKNARFYNGSTEILESIVENFDIIIVSAVLHHLQSNHWKEILEKLYSKLNDGGKIVILDIVFHRNQHPIAKLLVGLDRGISVLDIDEYLTLLKGNYRLDFDLRTDLMRVPYSQIISTIYKN
jgi:ubiquinone/menaquinone biosynthesis C-methylase UbiE